MVALTPIKTFNIGGLNMGCINLKYRTKTDKKTKRKIIYKYCKVLRKKINGDECYGRNCANKEYKKIKCTINRKNCAKIIKTKKNPKIAKLERNRKSVFTNDLTKCILCGKPKEELHEIFAGRNRLNSMRYNFVLPLCHNCHSINQNNSQFNEFWHKKAQLYYEQHLGSRNEFISIFGMDYYNKKKKG